MTDDIKEIRAALAHVKADAIGGWWLPGVRKRFEAACHPERIARLLDALEAAQAECDAWRKRATASMAPAPATAPAP